MKDIVAVHFQAMKEDVAEFLKDVPEQERRAEDLSGTVLSQ